MEVVILNPNIILHLSISVSTGADRLVTKHFGGSGPMFTWLVRVGCKFPAYRGESVKYQTCLIFPRPSPTLVSDPNFRPLATGLSINLRACRLHFQACHYHLQACRNMKPACLL